MLCWMCERRFGLPDKGTCAELTRSTAEVGTCSATEIGGLAVLSRPFVCRVASTAAMLEVGMTESFQESTKMLQQWWWW